MPILKNTSDQSALWGSVSGRGLLLPIETTLPQLYFPDRGPHDPPAYGEDSKAKSQWGKQILWREQDFGQNVIAQTATSVGFPKGSIFNGARSILLDENPASTLQTTFQAIGGVMQGGEGGLGANFELGGKLAATMEDVLGPSLEAIGHVAMLASSLVPIVGGVVKALAAVLKFLAPEGEEGEDHFYYLSHFKPGHDTNVVNEDILEVINRGPGTTRDWTNIWRPLGIDHWWSTPIRQRDDAEWGVHLSRRSSNLSADEGMLGAIPHSGNICQGWEINQSGEMQYGTRSLGAMLPTAKDQVAKLWAMALKPGTATSFCIDTSVLRDEWSNNLTWLRYYLSRDRLLGSGGLSRAARGKFVDEIGEGYFGWGQYDPALEDDGVVNQSFDVLAGVFGIENSTIMKDIQTLESVQASSVNTIACAYANQRFVALRPGQPLHSRWKQNRIDLLQHSAVCRVDLENIPDVEYRNAVRDAQTLRSCLGGGLKLSAGPGFKPSGPDAPPQTPGLSGIISAKRVGSGGGSGALLIAAAMLGLIVMKNRS